MRLDPLKGCERSDEKLIVCSMSFLPAVQGGTDAASDGMGFRTLPVLTEVKGAAAKTAYHDGLPEGKRPKSERAKATAAKVKVES
jgi:hypothetical protein